MLSNQWHVSVRIFLEAQNRIWLYILAHPQGFSKIDIVRDTGFSHMMVEACLEELFGDDKIFRKDGRWYPENDT